MHYENAEKFEEEKVLIHTSPFLKETSNLQTHKVHNLLLNYTDRYRT